MKYPRLVADMGVTKGISARMVEVKPNMYAVGTVFEDVKKSNSVRTCDYPAGVSILLRCWTMLHGMYNYIYIMKGDHMLLTNLPKIWEIGGA